MKILILLFLAYLVYRLIRKHLVSAQGPPKSPDGAAVDEMVQDPLCKTYVPLRSARRKVIQGREYFFCSNKCAEEFQEKHKV
jgi:YHS domain-containing protein